MADERVLLHATAVAIDGRAAVILGPSGAGKSDLALRLITTPIVIDGRALGALLVADDQVVIERRDGKLLATPPPALAGLIEVRGLGILRLSHLGSAEVALAVRLKPAAEIERLPDPPARQMLAGIEIAAFDLDGREASAPVKLALALREASRN